MKLHYDRLIQAYMHHAKTGDKFIGDGAEYRNNHDEYQDHKREEDIWFVLEALDQLYTDDELNLKKDMTDEEFEQNQEIQLNNIKEDYAMFLRAIKLKKIMGKLWKN